MEHLKYKYEDLAANSNYTAKAATNYKESDTTAIRSYGYQEEIGENAGDWFANLFTTDYFWNQNREPAVSFNFFLRIEGAFDAPCRSVRAFTKENDFEEIQEGGRNDYIILKRKPNTRRFTLQVERYVGIDKVDPLQLGTEMILPMILAVSRVTSSGDGGFIDTMKETEFIRFYAFTGCIVTGKEYGELNAEQSGLLKEVTTIAYREMIALTTPNADLVKKPWSIQKPDENIRRSDTFDFFDAAKATANRWDIREAPGGIKVEDNSSTGNTNTTPVTDVRSAARPVNDTTHATAKRWGGKDPKKADPMTNRSAARPVPSDANPEPKLWGGMDPKKRDKKANKSAVPNQYDGKKAEASRWDIKKDAGTLNNRKAEAPTGDDKRARIKSWNMDPTKSRQKKADKPIGDRHRAKVKYFTVKRPKKNLMADKPAVDSVKAQVKGYVAESNTGQVADKPKNDKVKASARGYVFRTNSGQVAGKPENDKARARAKKFAIKEARVSSSKAKAIKWKVSSPKSDRKADVPKQDSKRATAKRWDIKKPGLNRSAVTIKGAAEVAKFLSGGK